MNTDKDNASFEEKLRLKRISIVHFFVDVLLAITAIVIMFNGRLILGFVIFGLIELREINRNIGKINEHHSSCKNSI